MDGRKKDMGNEIEKLQKIIDESDNIVFFGGAGVSTESGIPDFRRQDGLYNQKYDYQVHPGFGDDFKSYIFYAQA